MSAPDEMSPEKNEGDSWSDAPTLRRGRAVLEPIEMRHAAGILQAADDNAVFTHLRVKRPETLSDAEDMVRTASAARTAGTSLTWAQTIDGEVTGLTTYYDLSQPMRSLAIGSTWIAKRWQRTGVNREAKLMLLTRAFDVLGCLRVVWHTDERNTASRNAILALGATQEGYLRKHRPRQDGTWRTRVQFSMTDDDWPEARRRLTAQIDKGVRPPRDS